MSRQLWREVYRQVVDQVQRNLGRAAEREHCRKQLMIRSAGHLNGELARYTIERYINTSEVADRESHRRKDLVNFEKIGHFPFEIPFGDQGQVKFGQPLANSLLSYQIEKFANNKDRKMKRTRVAERILSPSGCEPSLVRMCKCLDFAESHVTRVTGHN